MPLNGSGYIANYFKQQKKALLASLGGQCIACNNKNCLQFHHIYPYTGKKHHGRGQLNRLCEWMNYPERFALLCEDCHIEYHLFYDDDINPNTLFEFILKKMKETKEIK